MSVSVRNVRCLLGRFSFEGWGLRDRSSNALASASWSSGSTFISLSRELRWESTWGMRVPVLAVFFLRWTTVWLAVLIPAFGTMGESDRVSPTGNPGGSSGKGGRTFGKSTSSPLGDKPAGMPPSMFSPLAQAASIGPSSCSSRLPNGVRCWEDVMLRSTEGDGGTPELLVDASLASLRCDLDRPALVVGGVNGEHDIG